MFGFHQILSQFYHFTGNFKNYIICLLPQISQAKLGQFQLSGGVLESSRHFDFKTVTGFEFWARFIGDIIGFWCIRSQWRPLYVGYSFSFHLFLYLRLYLSLWIFWIQHICRIEKCFQIQLHKLERISLHNLFHQIDILLNHQSIQI